MNKPCYINVIATGHGDREAALELEKYDFSMETYGEPVFHHHDINKFVETVYSTISEHLPDEMSLTPDTLYDGATLWIPATMSQYDAFMILDRVCETVDLLVIMQHCRLDKIPLTHTVREEVRGGALALPPGTSRPSVQEGCLSK